MPINCTIIVDVQDIFHFDLELISDSGQGHTKISCMHTLYKTGGTFMLCVRDSAETASHICTYLVPINCTIIVDVQDIFHFDLELISDSGRGHKKLSCMHTLYKTGGTLCARLSRNRFTYLHIPGANQLYNHCRCATHLSC